jgi:hypothetical protein
MRRQKGVKSRKRREKDEEEDEEKDRKATIPRAYFVSPEEKTFLLQPCGRSSLVGPRTDQRQPRCCTKTRRIIVQAGRLAGWWLIPSRLFFESKTRTTGCLARWLEAAAGAGELHVVGYHKPAMGHGESVRPPAQLHNMHIMHKDPDEGLPSLARSDESLESFCTTRWGEGEGRKPESTKSDKGRDRMGEKRAERAEREEQVFQEPQAAEGLFGMAWHSMVIEPWWWLLLSLLALHGMSSAQATPPSSARPCQCDCLAQWRWP